MKIIGATVGNCVHTAGILKFLDYAESLEHTTIFLETRKSIPELVSQIEKIKPDLVALSYRLSPEPASRIFEELKKEIAKRGLKKLKFAFGGTEPVCEVARGYKIFDFVVATPSDFQKMERFLRPKARAKKNQKKYPQTLTERIKASYPYPLLRHHFGRPSLTETIKGAKLIAQTEVLDILSLGPDQNAQEHFFHPERMNHKQDGAGGVPLRSPGDLKKIYDATRCGNYPLSRCYAGTNDLIKWAQMTVKTINNAWGAIPIFWYSILDGRSNRPLQTAITENQQTIRWYAKRGIPVEINDSHQWALRWATPGIQTATAFLAAYNAKRLGVQHYIFQYMFNTPPETTPKMDIAKMLVIKDLIENLQDKNFTIYTMVRTGLASLAADPDIAKGQLASSTILSLFLKPHIVHVVGFSEANHAATAKEIIESCKIVHGVLEKSLLNWPELSQTPEIKRRKEKIKREAGIILEKIRKINKSERDPLLATETLSLAVERGILDAPYLRK